MSGKPEFNPAYTDGYADEKGPIEDPDLDSRERRKSSSVFDNIPEETRRESIVKIHDLVAVDAEHEISYRTMSWQKAAWLLCGEQVCLAIMAQSWSLSVLGWGAGLATMFGSAILFYFTSLTMHRFIMKYPQIKDFCDFAYYACGKSRIAYECVGVMLLLNNVMLIGFHIFTGAKVLNTLSDHSQCTVVFQIIVTLMGIVLSIPRTLKHVSFMSMFSASAMAIAILLFMIFAGIEDHPGYGYHHSWPKDGYHVYTLAAPQSGITWVNAMNAVLNITFLWVPQLLFPTFISEMERPQDFPKALTVLAAVSGFLFIVPPAVGYVYLGQYSTAPAFGSLSSDAYRKGSFAFVIVPTLIIGVIYANVSAKYVYFRILGSSRHSHSNTLVGWGTWMAVVIPIWIIGWIFAEVIPSMGDFLSLLGAAFDSWFGFLFFAIAYYEMFRGQMFSGAVRSAKTAFHVLVLCVGLFLLGPGLYAACEAIIVDYASTTATAFSCADVQI